MVSPRPTVISPGEPHAAPTANLTRLANALGLRHRSFTTLIFTPAGLPLTRPVDIRITYISPMNVPQQFQASYVASTGNRFLYNDVVGDGSKRRMTFDITLIERRPANPPIEYSFFWQADLDPLFDVSTGPLSFKLRSDCDWFGESEIELLMVMPDGTHRHKNFGLSSGGTRSVNEFVWSHAEASASLGLKQAFVTFLDDDPNYSLFTGGATFQVDDTLPLVPGTTREVRFTDSEDTDDCSADMGFTESHTPRYYYELTP